MNKPAQVKDMSSFLGIFVTNVNHKSSYLRSSECRPNLNSHIKAVYFRHAIFSISGHHDLCLAILIHKDRDFVGAVLRLYTHHRVSV